MVKELQELTTKSEEEREFKGKNKQLMLKILHHAADIGNPTRPFDIAKVWSI